MTVHESSPTGSSSIEHAKKRDLDLGPMTLKFNMVCEVIEVHVRAKFPQPKCSGS